MILKVKDFIKISYGSYNDDIEITLIYLNDSKELFEGTRLQLEKKPHLMEIEVHKYSMESYHVMLILVDNLDKK